MLLGAILAGGSSSRFGTDKALHLYRGKPLIAHVADALSAAGCAEIAVAGRNWGGHPALQDLPARELGPMGGLCAALHHGLEHGFDAVLAAPCDLLDIPADAASRLAPAPAVADGQWLLGLWPCAGAARLEALLQAEGAISARRWAAAAEARTCPFPLMKNINTLNDVNYLT